jgi:hypothetical protein
MIRLLASQVHDEIAKLRAEPGMGLWLKDNVFQRVAHVQIVEVQHGDVG